MDTRCREALSALQSSPEHVLHSGSISAEAPQGCGPRQDQQRVGSWEGQWVGPPWRVAETDHGSDFLCMSRYL